MAGTRKEPEPEVIEDAEVTEVDRPAATAEPPRAVVGEVVDAAGRALAVYDHENVQSMQPVRGAPILHFGENEMQIIRDQIAPDCNDGEIAFFVAYSKRVGLDPVARQIYAIRRKTRKKDEATGAWTDVYRMTIQTSIDGLRLIAMRTGEYAGRRGPEWCDRDGLWTDVWLKDEPPAASRVGVMRHGFVEPLYSVAHWKEYAPVNNQGRVTGMWEKMPAGQLAKCAEALALRSAFPAELSGIYTDDEMDQATAAERRETDPTGGTSANRGNGNAGRQQSAAVERDVARPQDLKGAISILEGIGVQFPIDWVKEALQQKYEAIPDSWGELTDEQRGWASSLLVKVADWMNDHYKEIDTPIGPAATIEQIREAFGFATEGMALQGPVEKIEEKLVETSEWIFRRQVERGLRNDDGTYTEEGQKEYGVNEVGERVAEPEPPAAGEGSQA